jgi:hypothetical protein
MATANLDIPYLTTNQTDPEVPENAAKDIADAALGGVLSVVLSGAYTLNNTGTYPREVHYGTLKVSGTANTITVPSAIKKKYIVHNTTVGSVILSQGGTTVSVPAGSIYYMYCDGTNVYRIT